MYCSIQTYPLSHATISRLSKAGFTYQNCLKEISPESLEKATTGLTKEECSEVLSLVNDSEPTNSTTSAHAVLKREHESCAIVTFCQKIDGMLGEGVKVGQITEFCGMPGTGKTQLSMQLSVDVTIPECFGGLHGQAIYIDTEGSFVAQRIGQIAQATVNHCQLIAKSTNDQDVCSLFTEMSEQLKDYNVDIVMKSVHYLRCKSLEDLLSLPTQLSQLVRDVFKHVKLIVIDNVAFHLRQKWTDMSSRSRLMSSLTQNLLKLAATSQLAVVLMNQTTTKITDISSKTVPAMGDTWAHLINNRVLLYSSNGMLFAQLHKSENRKDDTVPFSITSDGIRDVPVDEQSNLPAHKRIKLDGVK